jgi:hypothetical protein
MKFKVFKYFVKDIQHMIDTANESAFKRDGLKAMPLCNTFPNYLEEMKSGDNKLFDPFSVWDIQTSAQIFLSRYMLCHFVGISNLI